MAQEPLIISGTSDELEVSGEAESLEVGGLLDPETESPAYGSRTNGPNCECCPTCIEFFDDDFLNLNTGDPTPLDYEVVSGAWARDGSSYLDPPTNGIIKLVNADISPYTNPIHHVLQIQVDFGSAAGAVRLLFDYVDANNHWYAEFVVGNGSGVGASATIGQVRAGVDDVVDQMPAIGFLSGFSFPWNLLATLQICLNYDDVKFNYGVGAGIARKVALVPNNQFAIQTIGVGANCRIRKVSITRDKPECEIHCTGNYACDWCDEGNLLPYMLATIWGHNAPGSCTAGTWTSLNGTHTVRQFGFGNLPAFGDCGIGDVNSPNFAPLVPPPICEWRKLAVSWTCNTVVTSALRIGIAQEFARSGAGPFYWLIANISNIHFYRNLGTIKPYCWSELDGIRIPRKCGTVGGGLWHADSYIELNVP